MMCCHFGLKFLVYLMNGKSFSAVMCTVHWNSSNAPTANLQLSIMFCIRFKYKKKKKGKKKTLT